MTLDITNGGTGAVTVEGFLRNFNLGTLSKNNEWSGDNQFNSVNVVVNYSVNGVQVLTERITGWEADTGSTKRTSNSTYIAPVITDPPTDVEVQDIANALQDISETLKALKDDLIEHGLIGV